GRIDVRVVGNPDLQPELPDLAVVVQDLADDLAVGYYDFRTVRVPERGIEKADVEHLAFFLDDGNVLAYAERTREDDGEPGHDVSEHPLHGERDSRAGHTEPGDEREQFHPEVLQRHDEEQPEDEKLGDALEQHAHRRLQVIALQRAAHGARHPAAG